MVRPDAIEPRPGSRFRWTGDFPSGDGDWFNCAPIHQVLGAFQNARAGGIAAEDELDTLAIALFAGEREQMQADRFKAVRTPPVNK